VEIAVKIVMHSLVCHNYIALLEKGPGCFSVFLFLFQEFLFLLVLIQMATTLSSEEIYTT